MRRLVSRDNYAALGEVLQLASMEDRSEHCRRHWILCYPNCANGRQHQQSTSNRFKLIVKKLSVGPRQLASTTRTMYFFNPVQVVQSVLKYEPMVEKMYRGLSTSHRSLGTPYHGPNLFGLRLMKQQDTSTESRFCHQISLNTATLVRLVEFLVLTTTGESIKHIE